LQVFGDMKWGGKYYIIVKCATTEAVVGNENHKIPLTMFIKYIKGFA